MIVIHYLTQIPISMYDGYRKKNKQLKVKENYSIKIYSKNSVKKEGADHLSQWLCATQKYKRLQKKLHKSEISSTHQSTSA